MPSETDLKKRVGRKLTKKRREGHEATMNIPERFRDGDDADDDITAMPGNNPYMNQSVFGMIAAAGSQVDFNARFDAQSSDEEDGDAGDEHASHEQEDKETEAGKRFWGEAQAEVLREQTAAVVLQVRKLEVEVEVEVEVSKTWQTPTIRIDWALADTYVSSVNVRHKRLAGHEQDVGSEKGNVNKAELGHLAQLQGHTTRRTFFDISTTADGDF
jgi:hypothetical protein